MDKKLFTVCIPFKNEREEVGLTCKSIRETAGDQVDIIVVNDCSNDGYDYESDLHQYNVKYYITSQRIGSSAGKQLCVDLCQTPYFLILDAHCRIYTKDWLQQAIKIMSLPESEHTIYCCKCWYFHDDNDHQSPSHMSAYGGYWDYNIKSIFSCGWNLYNFSPNQNDPFVIPCILGANYICSKEYWNYLNGYKGLQLYGREETFISLKSWMSGGRVKCIPSICTGHKTRQNNIQPYDCYCYEIMHNELVIAYICVPEQFQRLCECWKSLYKGFAYDWQKATTEFYAHIDEIDDLKKEFESIKKYSQNQIDLLNATFQKRIGFDYQKLKEQNKGTYTKYNSEEKITFGIG